MKGTFSLFNTLYSSFLNADSAASSARVPEPDPLPPNSGDFKKLLSLYVLRLGQGIQIY